MNTLLDILSQRAQQQPKAPFLQIGIEEPPVSTLDLIQASIQFHVSLNAQGMKPGDRILLVAGRHFIAIAALFGVWRSGLFLSVANAYQSPEFILRCANRFQPRICLIDEQLENTEIITAYLKQQGFQCCYLKECFHFAKIKSIPSKAYTAHAPALCLFTSGSTGLPKGVIHSLQTLTHAAKNQASAQCLTPADRSVGVLPLSHVHGFLFPILAPLVSGGTASLFIGDFIPKDFLNYVQKVKATWFTTVPMHYRLLLDDEQGAVSVDLSQVRFARCASAPLSPTVWQGFEERYGKPLINTLGMTETAGQIFAVPIQSVNHSHSIIGIPYGFEVYLHPLSESTTIVNPSSEFLVEVGEAWIRGPAMMLGYLKETSSNKNSEIESTAIEYPFEEGGWLKTGDVIGVDQQGYYYILGRTKEIAIFAGINISLLQLEQELEQDPQIKAATAISEPHPLYGEGIAIFLETVHPKIDETFLSHLLHTCRQALPSPSALNRVILVDTLSFNATGKKIRDQTLWQEPRLLEISGEEGNRADNILNILGHRHQPKIHNK